jgi:PRC-barrel domain
MYRACRIAMLASALAVLSPVSSADLLRGQVAPPASERQLVNTATVAPPPARYPSSTIIVSSSDVEGVVGKEVRSIAGENMGRIVEIVVDRAGQVRAAVIDFGGFFGVGNRRIAVDWSLLQFDTTGDARGRFTLQLTQDQVRAAPGYKPDKTVVIVSAAGDPASWQTTGSATRE